MDSYAPVWLRRRISERLYLARHAIELGNAAEWTELSSGVLMTVAPDAPQDNWDGVHPMGDSSLTRLMEANDPQDTIARCEAELAILEICERIIGDRANFTVLEKRRAEQAGEIIRLLASGYKHRPGWDEGCRWLTTKPSACSRKPCTCASTASGHRAAPRSG